MPNSGEAKSQGVMLQNSLAACALHLFPFLSCLCSMNLFPFQRASMLSLHPHLTRCAGTAFSSFIRCLLSLVQLLPSLLLTPSPGYQSENTHSSSSTTQTESIYFRPQCVGPSQVPTAGLSRSWPCSFGPTALGTGFGLVEVLRTRKCSSLLC